MSSIVKEVRLIKADSSKNSNKHWTGLLHSDGSITSQNGRVGVTCVNNTCRGNGERDFDRLVESKLRDGYSQLRTVNAAAASASVVPVGAGSLFSIAKSQIKFGNATLEKLIERLVKANIHRITANTQVQYNAASGLFSTPLGVVTQDGLDEARVLLGQIHPLVAANRHSSMGKLVNSFMQIIPQNVGTKRFTAQTIFPDLNSVAKHQSILDSLEGSLSILNGKTSEKGETIKEKVFDTSLDILTNEKERERIITWYNNTNKAMHGYTNVKVAEIYLIEITEYNSQFEQSDANKVEVWHGTSQANVLSVLRSGLMTTAPSTAKIAGKCFGSGIYGSQTSSKSLGYTLGKWGNSVGDAGWLFVCDFAMGKSFYPTSYGITGIPKGYDSCWALPEKTGLLNDELIVYSSSKVRMKYMLEIK